LSEKQAISRKVKFMAWWFFLIAIFLYLACAALFIAEVFIPSGGVISVLALVCFIGGVAIFFHHSVGAGIIGIVVAVVMIPTVWVIAYKRFPQSRFGKSIMLAASGKRQGDAVRDSEQLGKLLGAEGTVLTPLRPVGMAEFGGQRLECVAESGYVEKDKKVKVIHVEGTQLTVRVAEES
jgi:membrane-bound ClpP family serine protease